MKAKVNYCGRCKNFVGYYQKILYGYCGMGVGHCRVKNCLQDEFGKCERYTEKPQNDISAELIDCAICETERIKQLLKNLKSDKENIS